MKRQTAATGSIPTADITSTKNVQKKKKEKYKVVEGENISCRLPQCLVPVILLDKKLTKWLAVCANEHSVFARLRTHMKLLEISCHGVPWFTVCAALLVYSWSAEMTEVLTNLFIALFLDIVLVAMVKAAVRRARPEHNNMDMFATVSVDHYSFPSGHASRAVLVLLLLANRCNPSPMLSALFATWSLVVCASRVLLGRHHVTDVIFGGFMGYGEFKLSEMLWLSQQTCQNLLSAMVNFDPEPLV